MSQFAKREDGSGGVFANVVLWLVADQPLLHNLRL
jgi:hypothetical protein